MENNGNPAQRLYEIAKEASSFEPSERSLYVWGRIFEISPTEQKKFTRDEENRIVSLVNECRELVDLVEDLLKKNPEIPHDIYLRPFPKLKKLFCKPSQITSEHRQNCTLEYTDLTLLEACIYGVNRVYSEKVVDENELKNLAKEVSELYETIIGLDIDKNLKRILLDMLKVMENAIHEYRIRGIERIGEAVERLIGIYICNKEQIKASKVKEVGKVKQLLSKFGALWAFAADSKELLGDGSVVTNAKEIITRLSRLLGAGE